MVTKILDNHVLKEYKKTLLETFFENSYDGIFITDKDGKLILANDTIMQLLETKSEEIIGYNVQDIISKGYYDKSPALESTKTGKIATDIVKTPGGVEILSTSRPIFNENGQLELVVTNCRPLNYIKKIYDELNTIRKNRHIDNTSKNSKALIFKSNVMKNILAQLELISRSDSSVMIYGESGTGKSVLAKYIHENSPRFKQQFVEINCAAIPEHLIESELFGYEKGAFTGANTKGKLGLFEIADEGTIFLDEIAEMPLSLQSKLLKVLDSSYIRRVGGTADHKINVRVIAATNKDLKELVQRKSFREDLYYRLNVVPIYLPPLRKRKEDIKPLLDDFLKYFNNKFNFNKSFSPKSIETFLNYPWPGNIRELRNVIERLIITSADSLIDINSLSDNNSLSDTSKSTENTINQSSTKYLYDLSNETLTGTLKEVVSRVEHNYINKTIEECQGCMTDAAKKLGVHRTLLYKKLEKYKM